jgi:tripartite-type tricarboxylate transporter receptor subunit TctC
MQEAGFAQYQVSAWFGLAVQRGTPAEASTRLQDALRKVLAQKELGATIAARGVAVEFMDANQTTEFMQADTARWQKVAKYAGITLD